MGARNTKAQSHRQRVLPGFLLLQAGTFRARRCEALGTISRKLRRKALMSDPADDATQKVLDAFYFKTGPCCAGCDHWRHAGPTIGECTLSPPVSQEQRLGYLGITSCSMPESAGHVLTKRDDKCGQFRDDFDWSQLPLAYRRSIGCDK